MQTVKEKTTGERSILPISGERIDSNYTHRIIPGSEPNRNQKFRKRTDRSRITSFCHVTGPIKQKIRAQITIQADKVGKFLSQIAPLICAHPDFKDKDWLPGDEITDVLRHIICEFRRLTPDNLNVLFHIDDQKVTPYWIFECQDCHSYGNLLSCQWLQKLGKRHRKLYSLAIDFFSFCFHQLGMAIWNEYDEECQIEFLLEEMSYGDQTGEVEHEDLANLKRDIKYFRTYAVAHYASLIIKNKVTTKDFEQRLNNYKPRKRKYQSFKKWMLQAIDILRLGFDFKEVDCPFIIPEDAFNNGELEPYRYLRFIWDENDHINRSLIEGVDEVASNCGVIPLMEFEMVTPDRIADPSTLFGKSQIFFDWMTAGHKITDSL